MPAAALSLWCGPATFFSIGLFILPLTALQLGLAGVLLYQHSRADRTWHKKRDVVAGRINVTRPPTIRGPRRGCYTGPEGRPVGDRDNKGCGIFARLDERDAVLEADDEELCNSA